MQDPVVPSPDHDQALNVAPQERQMDCTKGIMFSFQSSIFMYEDKSFYDKITTSFSEHQTEGNESSPTDVPSQKESGKLDVKEQEEGHPIGELGPWPALSMQPWAPWHRGPES